MNSIDLMQNIENRFLFCKQILNDRKSQYCSNDDRLSNFKRGAEIVRLSNEKYAFNLMTKQLTSVLDIIDEIVVIIDEQQKADILAEKFTDLHNYLFLIENLFIEKRIENAIKNSTFEYEQNVRLLNNTGS